VSPPASPPSRPEARRGGGEPPRSRVSIGYVIRAHGLRGALRLRCESGDAKQTAGSLLTAKTLYLDEVAYAVTRARADKDEVLVELEGVADRDAADALRGKAVSVDRDTLPEPDEDELYLADLVGCAVVAPDGSTIGAVKGSYDSGAQDVLIVDTSRGEKLLPFVEPMLVEVDLDARRIVYDAPPGLIDDDAELAK